MGRPRPYLGEDNCWHDDVTGLVSPPFIDAHDAENSRIANQRLAWNFERKAAFYKAIEEALADD